jgi:transcriptional regulator of acetoin/glycerol metabolism
VIEHAALLANDDVVHTSDLVMLNPQKPSALQTNTWMSLDQAEAEYLRTVCDDFQGTPAELAHTLKVSTRTLYRKLQQYGLKLTNPS